jgi:GNAT superfamily N-acetyltransferase
MIERFSEDVPEVGANVIRVVAADLRNRGIPLWAGCDLSAEALCADGGGKIITGYIGEMAVAAMVFSDYDPEFWPDIPRGASTFVHKLAVLPALQGKGIAREMLNYAAELSLAAGIQVTRLDCAADRPKLCSVYQNAGYSKVFEKMVGSYPTAFYERVIKQFPQPDAPGTD